MGLRSLPQKGIRWRVRAGKSIDAWKDAWLLLSRSRRVRAPLFMTFVEVI